MKIVIEQLESIEGVEIYAIIGLLIFFAMFVILLVHTIRLDRQIIKTWGNIPLEDDDSGSAESKNPKNTRYGTT